jgi:hypothetical protein
MTGLAVGVGHINIEVTEDYSIVSFVPINNEIMSRTNFTCTYSVKPWLPGRTDTVSCIYDVWMLPIMVYGTFPSSYS